MKYIAADKITPIMAEYVADVFSRKEHLDDISYGYCMEIADVFRQYAERAKQEQPEVDLKEEIASFFSKNPIPCEHITDWPLLKNTAIHFFNLGLNARKK